MKNILTSLILVLIFISCQENQFDYKKKQVILSKIDSLDSEEEVELYIRKKDTLLSKFELKKFNNFNRGKRFEYNDSILKEVAINKGINESYYKVDIDNNGYTDIVIIGNDNNFWGDASMNYSTFALMSFQNDSISVHNLIKSSFLSAALPEFNNENGDFIIHQPKFLDDNPYSSDTLVYKFNSFIEFNKNPIDNNISKIVLSTGPCLGTCPIFKLSINNIKNGALEAEMYNYKNNRLKDSFFKEGEYECIIRDSDFQLLFDIVNYLDFKNLNESYSAPWTDDSGSILEIFYNEGEVKRIVDYGMIGNYGLMRVYNIMYELRFNQDWNKIN
jgi:hypothetical protein